MPPWSRDAIAARILNGETLIVYRGHLLAIPKKWLDAHPGGSLALLHFVGRDASDEIDACHSDATLALIPKYSIGPIDVPDDLWLPLVPPIAQGWVRQRDSWVAEAAPLLPSSPGPSLLLVDKAALPRTSSGPTLDSLNPLPSSLSLELQARHSSAWRSLHTQITQAGLYKTRYLTGYGPEVLRYLFFALTAAYTYKQGYLVASAVFLGFLWHQLTFTAHDLGHMGVTHNWAVDRILGTLIADFIGGLSIGWWVHNHNVHHLVTNHPSHDPDIQHIPFFAISPAFLQSLWSSYYKRVMKFDTFAKFILSLQHKLFYVVMAFARFNLYANSYVFLYQRAFDTRRARGGNWAWRLEIFGLLIFWTWYSALLYGCGSWQKALVYLIISHVVPSPLHVQIVLSHFSMSTEDLGPVESFPHRQLRTTTDVICSDNIAFLHGGLHLQVTHHLFPRLPRHNLRRASELVKKFAKDEGLVYAEFGFADGNKQVIGTLKHVADQIKILGNVANQEAKEALDKKNAALGLKITHASRVDH